jgi:hypothetical protein
MSNFRFYQDRETGDLVIFLTRYGEQSEKEWVLPDYYRYRVELPKWGAAEISLTERGFLLVSAGVTDPA